MRRWSTPGGAWWPGGPSQEAEEREKQALWRLLTALAVRYGPDFRAYHPEAVRRRVWNVVHKEGLSGLPELHERLLSDPACATRLIQALPVGVTELFRDPGFWRAFRARALPLLRELARPRVWHAGCATGEEAFSMAILLHEEGLLERAEILATDLDTPALLQAQRGALPLARMQSYTANYRQAGGAVPFSEYYAAGAEAATLRADLRARIAFAWHDLAAHPAPGRFDVVLCRNVLIYFGGALQERVARQFVDCLRPGGLLALGGREMLPLPVRGCFEPLDPDCSLFRKRG